VNSAVILAGGNGKRINSDFPKQFIKVKNKRIIDYSIDTFKKNKNINEIILVLHKDWVHHFKNDYHNFKLVEGGSSRYESSFNGILSCSVNTENVLIHDAARPLLTQKIIDNCINNLSSCDATTPYFNVSDSMILKDSNSVNYLNRSKIKSIQTPQAFNKNIIIDAMKNAQNIGTDDISTLLNYNSNLDIKFFKGDKNNFKITNDIDLKIFESLLNDK